MFKLESYITPILLSYVDKYIKNFRPEDSQVSLWGGDAFFHNLDLRLDVLEEELQLPFNLVSGHIHELLIHVPWTKLASEPINITINTIECVLKLRGSETANSEGASGSKETKRKQSHSKKQEIAAPPGYVQSLINKIVNNISINCNNLILKYVEEDIVVSVNIKLLTFQSANAEWQAAYTEISPTQMTIRKLITLSDLTVCLDKRNAAGKIEIYQEPVLYRCSVEMRFLRQFYSNSSDKIMNTRLDIHCNRMEFSMTEQQIPMLMRIINLLIALQQRQLKDESSTEVNQGAHSAEDGSLSDINNESWAGWAWSFAATIFPSEEDDSLEWNNEQQQSYSGNTFQCGVYIDHAIFTFKVSEYYANDRGYYATRKLKYWPLLCLQLNGCYTDTIIGGVEWSSVQMGIAEALLIPQGCCSCGLTDVSENIEAQYYLKTGIYNGNHILDSLFDPGRKPRSNRRNFTVSWDYYINTITEDVLLEKTSSFAIDYLYHLEVPDEYSSEKLSELGSDLEYSNLVEKSICRIVGGPLVVRLCSGLIHRMSTLQEVMNSYDYPPYMVPPSEPELSDLHPPSEDDFDALNNSIPSRIYQVTFLKPVFEFQLMDHPKFVPSKGNLFRRSKKNSGYFTYSSLSSQTCPNITLECETADMKMSLPVYPKRLVYTTCQLPDPPENMFNACYTNANIKITGFSSHMIFNQHKKTTILLPFNINCDYKSIIFPKYWINPEIIHEEITTEIDSITLSSTKAKLMVIYHIVDKFLLLDAGEFKNSIFASSLLQDATKDSGMVVLELNGEQLKWRRIYTMSTECHKINVDSLKAFVLEPSEIFSDLREMKSMSAIHEQYEENQFSRESKPIAEPNQVLIISGPEFSDFKSNPSIEKDNSLLTVAIQFPRNPEKCIHPPLLFFNLGEIKICVDPLLFQWLFYSPKYVYVKHDNLWTPAETIITYKPRAISDVSGTSLHETPRRANTPHESIHSSSERENNIQFSSSRPQNLQQEAHKSNSENKYYEMMLKWYTVWTNIVIFGDIKPCTIYFPTQSLPAVGSRGIEDAIEISLEQDSPIEIMVVKLPYTSIRTAGQRQSLIRYTSHLPITLPTSIWTIDKASFPWAIEIKKFCCYTLQNKNKLFFIKPISGNITIGLSIKYRANKENEVTLTIKKGKKVEIPEKLTKNINLVSMNVHIDNTPIEIALSEIQVCLISSISHALLEVMNKFFPIIEDKTRCKDDTTGNFLRKSQSRSQSPTFQENTSERTPTSPIVNPKNIEDDDIKFSMWMQWTITRLRIKLYGYNMDVISSSRFSYLMPATLKLVFELEDIMMSLDVQQIYSKFKLKIVTCGIHHYKRKSLQNEWEPGIYLGTVMRSREELPTSEKHDDFGFMSITVTKAKCGDLHNKWGGSKKHRLAEMKIEQQSSEENSETRYVSEVCITLQPMDFIISAKVLKNFFMVLEPMLSIPTTYDPKPKETIDKMACFNTTNLPLAYLDCNGLRIIILSSDLIEKREHHDICIIEIESINLQPKAENPICRIPIRPDIYQRAAQNRMLSVPGSEVEDRQYQFNIKSLSVNTGSWMEFSQILCRDSSVISSLHTMNENPALEWNNLEWGRSTLMPHLSLLPIIQKFNQCIVIAPAISCRNSVLVCGCSVEINCISDIEIFLSLHQFRLVSALVTELICFMKPGKIEFVEKRPKFTYFESNIIKNDLEQVPLDYAKDSGFETTDVNSEITSKTKESANKEAERRNILKFTNESRSSDISQCLKCTTVMSSIQHISNYCPLEILLTGGQISISLYKITNQKFIETKPTSSHKSKNMSPDDTGYEASEEESVDIPMSTQKVQPLLFVLISQPNVFFSDVALGKNLNFSCFDIYIKTNESKHSYIEGLPTPKDFQIFLMETKPGIPNTTTGIPPAFITLKWAISIGKTPSLDIDFGRPMRIFYSLDKLNHLLYLKKNVLDHFYDACSDLVNNSPDDVNLNEIGSDNYLKYKSIKNLFNGINNFNLKFSQIVFVFKTISGLEMAFSLEKLESFLTFLTRPERIIDIINFKNVAISSNVDESTKFLLNPWSCTLKLIIFWESWQHNDSDPQIQLVVDSDCFSLDVGPEQVKCIEAVMKECNDLLAMFTKPINKQSETSFPNMERDQYYKDDLRVGAFQFVDASGDPNELPLPYQVMFWNQDFAAMAWRYPQPRILTKVRVFPVPFKLNSDQSDNQHVLCFLEYWSECHGCYKSFAQFELSESEMCHLEMPKNVPQSAISCTWRVVLSFSDSKLNIENVNHFVSPRALAACMRIDSYFNPILVPKFQLMVNCFTINLSMYNQFNKKLALLMPEKLRSFTPDGLVPDNQCFLIFNAEYSNVFIASWYSDIATIDFKTTMKCCILDFSTLTLQPFFEPLSLMATINISDSINTTVLTESIKIKLSPTIGHTLAISSQLWEQNWLTNTNTEPPDMVVITRYVICNDTNLKLRFGQTGTDEDILLPSRFLHLYCWRSQKYHRHIGIGVEQNGWIWSKPINIDIERTEHLELVSEKRCTIIVSVRALSTTQKQIIFSGQLVICNMLLDHFELKVIPLVTDNKDLDLKNADSHIINGKSSASSSIVLQTKKKLALRLRFLSLESAWSGDIPLEENVKCSQPWLVKIPLQERGQFLSIWCRIVDKKKNNNKTILVMLWPLFMIRSYLPVNTNVQIATPALNVNLETNIRGRGELQQLYCPGTIDHSHHLTFDIGAEISGGSTKPIVPLNYSLIDHKQIFKRIDKEDISEILDYLKNFDKSMWPYVDNSLEFVNWGAEEQPVTNIQVRYKSACQYSSSLLIEIIPWCLLINTLGVSIAIIINGKQSCRIDHYGIVTPSKLETTFNIAVEMNESWNISPLLQFARADWSQTFYMPKINGVIPLEGNIKIPVKCGIQMCMMSITSSIINEIRFIQISSSYIITNHTKLNLNITSIALPNNNKTYNISDFTQFKSFAIESHLDKSNIGVPITTWNCIEDPSDSVSDYTFHLVISLGSKNAQSCPIQIDKNLSRKSICLYSDTQNIPLVIIAQEYKDLIYISLHHDIHPQLFIKNKCTQQMFCAQCDVNSIPIVENNSINWVCTINSNSETYYTMPSVADNFPNIDTNLPEKIILAVKSEDSIYQWSQEININILNEQYVRIPQYGDVKLSIKKITTTVIITIDSVTEVEISAQDIRSRLLLQSAEYNSITYEENNRSRIKSHDLMQNESSIDSKRIMPLENKYSSSSLSDLDVMSQFNSHSDIKTHWPPLTEYTVPNKSKWNCLNLDMVIKNIVFTLAMDDKFEKTDLTTLTCDFVAFTIVKNEGIDCCISVADIQCDNQLFNTGCYDFPVVLIGGDTTSYCKFNFQNTSIKNIIEEINNNADITINMRIEMWTDKITEQNITEIQEVKIKFGTLLMYIEDTYIAKLLEYMTDLLPTQLVVWSLRKEPKHIDINSGMIGIPEQLSWEAKILAKPLFLQSLSIEPLSLLLSLHSSVKLYIALDRSPLQFYRFERKNLMTTSYRLGHALTMHYLSGAIFGAGWVVGSLELLGSPSGLARTLGSGIRDFIRLPYNGLIQGPWAFLVGITHGSASLMRHVTAGTLDSVTKLAASVARNLDRLTLDEEHQRRTEELRRQRPQGLAQGFMQGLTGLGISLLGAVGGIAHHPLQSVMNDGASPRGLVAGVGLGLVGVFTKPLSGAAELVALTGQGLLQGAGWNPLPEPRISLNAANICGLDNSVLKYKWKFLQNTTLHRSLLAVSEIVFNGKRIVLIITFEALVIIDIDEDAIKRVISVSEINDVYCTEDPTEIRVSMVQPMRPSAPNAEPCEIEMDPVSRARVADYVKNSSGLVQMSPLGSRSNSDDEECAPSRITTPVKFAMPCLIFHVNPQIKNYLCDMLILVKQQNQNSTFKIV